MRVVFLRIAIVWFVLLFATPNVRAEDATTRYGTLHTTDDNNLLLNERAVNPPVQGNNGLSFITKFQIGSADIVLVEDDGGTACPALYYFVTVTAEAAVSSPSFGTCSDLIKTHLDGNAVTVTMPGFLGPFDPPAKQAAAAKEQHRYIFANGRLLSDGKAVEPQVPGKTAIVQPQANPTTNDTGVRFDPPIKKQTVVVPGAAGNPDSKVSCFAYRGFMVRQVNTGDDIGSASLSVTANTPPEIAPCSADKPIHEKPLSGYDGKDFAGAAGRFLLLVWPDGANGATSFSIFDATTSRQLYSDVVKNGVDGFTQFSPSSGNDALDIAFDRVAIAPCSLAGVDASCWSRFVKEAKLPAEIAQRPAPVAICATAYAKQKLTGRDLAIPSVVSYRAVMKIVASGGAKVISRGALSCWPSE